MGLGGRQPRGPCHEPGTTPKPSPQRMLRAPRPPTTVAPRCRGCVTRGVAGASTPWQGGQAERLATSRPGLAPGWPRRGNKKKKKPRHLCAREAASCWSGGGGGWRTPPPPHLNSTPTPIRTQAPPRSPRAPTPHSCGAGPPERGPHPALAARQQPSEVSLHAAGNKAWPSPRVLVYVCPPSLPHHGPPPGSGLSPPSPVASRLEAPLPPYNAAWMRLGRTGAPPGQGGGGTGKRPPHCHAAWGGRAPSPPSQNSGLGGGFPPATPSLLRPAQLQHSWTDWDGAGGGRGAARRAGSGTATSPGVPWAGGVLTLCPGEGGKRIQLDSSRLGADGHDAQGRVVGQGAGLAGEAVLHRLQRGQAGHSPHPPPRSPPEPPPLPPLSPPQLQSGMA